MSAEIAQHLPGLLLAFGLLSLGLFSPGPNVLAVMGTSMAQGRTNGMALALGIGTGSGVWATLTVLGLSSLLTVYAGAMTILKIVGAAYLLWLAFKAFRSAATQKDVAANALSTTGFGTLYRRGLVIQMTNPKAALHWVAIVALGIGPEAPIWVAMTLVIGATALSMGGHLIYAAAFSTKHVVAFYARARRIIEAGLGTFFCFASYKLLTSRS
jgi:threonine/homoserine/homoserine lactone efflux protein